MSLRNFISCEWELEYYAALRQFRAHCRRKPRRAVFDPVTRKKVDGYLAVKFPRN